MLVKLMNGIASMNLGNGEYSDNSIDAFGDAYEYLMGMYASNAGKSGGEYYTPQEVYESLKLSNIAVTSSFHLSTNDFGASGFALEPRLRTSSMTFAN